MEKKIFVEFDCANWPASIEDLPVEALEMEWLPITLNLLKVDAYKESFPSNEDMMNRTDIYLSSGESFVINVPYHVFDKIMTENGLKPKSNRK